MLKNIFAASVLSVFASFSGISSSEALPVDFIDNGSYTTDSLSGLDWLDLSYSYGFNYNYVKSQLSSGGVFDGWRYATNLDFAGLLNNWSGTTIADVSINDWNFPEAGIAGSSHGLVDLLGPAYPGYAIGILDEPHSNPGLHYAGELFDVDEINFKFHLADINQIAYYDNETGNIEAGSFLVRVSIVPLPASVWLFAAALGGLGFLASRRRRIA